MQLALDVLLLLLSLLCYLTSDAEIIAMNEAFSFMECCLVRGVGVSTTFPMTMTWLMSQVVTKNVPVIPLSNVVGVCRHAQ